jgi:TctA family transporter
MDGVSITTLAVGLFAIADALYTAWRYGGITDPIVCGVLMRCWDYPLTPLIVGLILGPMA